MSNYTESKKQLNAIRNKYDCKGDLVLRTAIQNVMEYGQRTILDNSWYQHTLDEIHVRHDNAEKEGKWLFMTRDFEIAILECSKDLAEVNSYDLLTYIQREIFLSAMDCGEPDYKRALQIIRNCLCYTVDRYGAYPYEPSEALYKIREMELTDDEIAYFGFEYLFDVEEEEEE